MEDGKKLGIILIFVFSFSFVYLFFVDCLGMDAVWNYGFAYNISKGLVPYRDFNMIITPFYSFLSSFFIIILGNYLYSIYILDALCITFIFLIGYKYIGNKMFVLLPSLLWFGYPSYNVFCLVLYFLLLFVYDRKYKNKDFILGVIVSLMFLTKQTVGIMFLLPVLCFSKNRKKTLLGFLIPCVTFLLYLLCNNCSYEFVDYCFLGMFDFTGGNGGFLNPFFWVEGIIIGYCIYNIVKSKFRDVELIFVLMFQIMAFPLFDIQHFILSFVPLLFYVIKESNISKNILIIIFLFFCVLLFQFYDSGSIVSDRKSFMYGKKIDDYGWYESFLKVNDYIKNVDNDKKVFILFQFAYLFRLEMGEKPDKYDLINKGNMGYKGDLKYIKEIDDYCHSNKCVFLVPNKKSEYQTDFTIINHVKKKYNKVGEVEVFEVYANYEM